MFTVYMFVVAAAVCWGVIGIFSSIAFAQGLAPMEVAFWRAVIAWICFASQAFILKETGMNKRDLPLLTVFAFLGISLFYFSYLLAVKTGGAAFASVLLYTAPAWVVVCSFFIYREKLTVVKALSVILVIFGVFLISKSGGNSAAPISFSAVAITSGLTAGFCYSLYYTIGKYFSQKYSSAIFFLYVLPIGALGILPFVDFVHKTPQAWLALIGVSFISTFIANYCYYQGLKRLEAGRASIVATLEPIVAAVAAYFFLGEYFSVYGYLGVALILMAVLLTIFKK